MIAWLLWWWRKWVAREVFWYISVAKDYTFNKLGSIGVPRFGRNPILTTRDTGRSSMTQKHLLRLKILFELISGLKKPSFCTTMSSWFNVHLVGTTDQDERVGYDWLSFIAPHTQRRGVEPQSQDPLNLTHGRWSSQVPCQLPGYAVRHQCKSTGWSSKVYLFEASLFWVPAGRTPNDSTAPSRMTPKPLHWRIYSPILPVTIVVCGAQHGLIKLTASESWKRLVIPRTLRS